MVQDKKERDGHQTSATAQCNLEEEKLTQARNTKVTLVGCWEM